ncbi:hypothetical protein SAMN03159494_05533 [Achromobacter sp. NFACC18-2]|nr:hypothetical protein SAMN03159494_05533 [Achromobacter sp. NFACC18-2]
MKCLDKEDYFQSNDGCIQVWIEQGTSIHIKAATNLNDPVELSESEALELAEVLKALCRRI